MALKPTKFSKYWWIGDYLNEISIRAEVNIALEAALDKVGIDLPFNNYDLYVYMEKNLAGE